jgi:hypothetical protein
MDNGSILCVRGVRHLTTVYLYSLNPMSLQPGYECPETKVVQESHVRDD